MNIRPRSRTVPVAAGLALAAAACGSEAGTDFRPRAEQPSTAAACTFGWPVPTRGRARQRMVSGGHVMEFRYVVRLERAPDGDGLALYREDVEVETVDDRRPAGDVEWMVATLEFGMPPLRIGADGSYRGMLDLDGYLADAAGPLEAILARDGLDETTRRAVQATVSMRSVPAAGPLLEASAGLAWLAWVGDWLGCELAPGAREDATVTASLPWGPYDAPVVRRNLGYVRAPAGHVDLRAEGTSRVGESTGAFGRAIMGMMLGGSAPDAVLEVRRRVVCDPTTMLPVLAEWRQEMTNDQNAERRTSYRVNRCEFEWTPAKR